MEDEFVFRALADPSRRRLLDLLFERDGRTLTELESKLPMTRFGVMKHLRVLQEAGLITTRKVGRERLHYLNPVPIQLISDRWISKYSAARTSVLADLKTVLEGGNGMTTTSRLRRSGCGKRSPSRSSPLATTMAVLLRPNSPSARPLPITCRMAPL